MNHLCHCYLTHCYPLKTQKIPPDVADKQLFHEESESELESGSESDSESTLSLEENQGAFTVCYKHKK